MYRRYFKRWLDIAISIIGLLLLSPLFLLLALCVKLDSRGPVFFRQKRVGIHKTHFMIIKFRTMRIDAPGDVPTHLLENAHRNITRCGKYLRKSSLDELPQLINVLRGDMSIVGPRPALWNQFDLIALRDQTGANDVLPGIAGLAQVKGRDRLENGDKAKYDGIYARNIGFRLDMKCILRAVGNIGIGEGIVEGIQPARRKAEESK
jgi:O-antigen biosynthesis protein WbqP